jgi:hypothetical protein
MQTNNSFVKIIRSCECRKQQGEAIKQKAKTNKPKHLNKRDIWSDTK